MMTTWALQAAAVVVAVVVEQQQEVAELVAVLVLLALTQLHRCVRQPFPIPHVHVLSCSD